MNKNDFNSSMMSFIDASPTPFHATRNMAMMLSNAGFIELCETQKWELKKGEKYFVLRADTSLIAFTYPKTHNYTMIGTHLDSPTLKLKPNPVMKEHGVVKFGVEPYGGLLLSSWFDRELSLGGRIKYLNSNDEIKDALIDVKKPIAIIPSLAIHLDDKADESKTINKQTDISPILTTDEDFEFEEFLKWQLSKQDIVDIKKLYASELSFYDVQKASFVGLRDDFIASQRLDNLLSCFVGLLSICSVPNDKPMLFISSNHEEVGSASTSGASGSFLENTLRRVFSDYEEFVMMIRSSIMFSCDNAHAIHPNFPSKHDKQHSPHINKGVVIKSDANQRYASNLDTITKFLHKASSIGEPTQQFVVRSDMRCGSTIGPITATRLGIETLDIGVPTLAMHSTRELCGSDDAHSLYKILSSVD